MLQGQDEVDRIVAAWGRERPDLDPRPLHAFSRVSRLSRRLDLPRRRGFIDHAPEGCELAALTARRRAGEPYELTAGRLLHETLVASGTMTNRMDRMVAHGYVVRAVGTTDRRVVLVRLTPRGKETVDAAMADLLHSEQELLAELDPAEAEQLTSLLRRLLLPLDS